MPAELPALLAVRRRLLRRARRLVSCPAEAEDLVQEALLAAHQAGRDWHDAATDRWLCGVLRRRAAFAHRTAMRRRARERRYAECTGICLQAGSEDRTPAQEARLASSVPRLPPSLRLVARLAAAGCTREEIAWVLDLAPTALRQRISAAGRRLRGAAVPVVPLSALATGVSRRAVLPISRRTGDLGTHDPDGHPILVGRSQNRGPRQPPG